MRLILALVTSYRFIAIPSVSITLVTALIFYQSQAPVFLVVAIWTKVITTVLLLLFVHFFRSSQFYFFYNLGCSTRSIYSGMALIDLMIAAVSFSSVLVLL
jgi:hypothetical protein